MLILKIAFGYFLCRTIKPIKLALIIGLIIYPLFKFYLEINSHGLGTKLNLTFTTISHTLVEYMAEFAVFFGIGYIIHYFTFIKKNNPPRNKVERQDKSLNSVDFLNESNDKLQLLNSLIIGQQKKLIKSFESKIPIILKYLITDKSSCEKMILEYNNRFGSNLMEQLAKLSSNYSNIYSYHEAFIDCGYCEKNFPHKVILE